MGCEQRERNVIESCSCQWTRPRTITRLSKRSCGIAQEVLLPFSGFDSIYIDFVFVFKTHLFHELACQESHFSLLSPTLKWLGAVPFPPEKRSCSKIHSLQLSTAIKFLTTNKLLRSHPPLYLHLSVFCPVLSLPLCIEGTATKITSGDVTHVGKHSEGCTCKSQDWTNFHFLPVDKFFVCFL